MLVKPKLTSEDVNEGGPLTARDGREYYMELPGVWTDSRWGSTTKTNDPAAFDKNRELAKRISAAFSDLKKTAKDGSHFILAWRMYPNKDHPRWHKEEHTCSCSCGCSSHGGPLPGG